jgi:DNA-binding HxlR family transcriptional regulator
MVAQNTARTAIRADECVAADASLVRALARAVPGISDSVLSDRLGELTEAGLVARTVAEGPPVSVTYTLTKAGRALLPALEQIRRWAERHLTTRGVESSATPALRQARRR